MRLLQESEKPDQKSHRQPILMSRVGRKPAVPATLTKPAVPAKVTKSVAPVSRRQAHSEHLFGCHPNALAPTIRKHSYTIAQRVFSLLGFMIKLWQKRSITQDTSAIPNSQIVAATSHWARAAAPPASRVVK